MAPASFRQKTHHVTVHRAQNIGDRGVPQLHLRAVVQFPADVNTATGTQIHEDEGRKIADALWLCLPGATLEWVIIHLLENTAGQLRVARRPLTEIVRLAAGQPLEEETGG